MRLGLISDTHIPSAGKELPSQVSKVFAGVALILHAGDLHILPVLDWLEQIAPVLAARGNGDWELPEDPRLKDSQVIQVAGLRLGLVHGLALPSLSLEKVFGGPVDVVVFGDTHIAAIERYRGVLLVNPGSPTFPNNLQLQLGTVGLLDIENGEPRARIVQLR